MHKSSVKGAAAKESRGEIISTPQPDWSRVFSEPVVSARHIDAGYENANDIWEVSTERGAFIVRIPRSPFGRPRHRFWNGINKLFNLHIHVDIENHRKLARFVAEHSPLQVPSVRYIDTSGEIVARPYTVVDRMPGRTASFEGSDAPERVAEALGRHLGSLHCARFDYWGVFEGTQRFKPGEWPERLADALGALADREGAQTDKVHAALERFQQQARALPTPEHLALIFPDLRPSQFMESDGELIALVDFDSMVIGPRELDLVAMEYSLTPALVKPFVEGYSAFLPLPPLAQVRPLYRFLYYLIDVLAEDDYDKWMHHEHYFHA